MKKALIVSNGIGAEEAFPNRADITFDTVQVGRDFKLELAGYDLLVVPNGADHVAMLNNRNAVREFLDAGNALACFCGWFTDWVPGNRWVHDNSHPTKLMRHSLGTDPFGLMEGVDVSRLDHNEHGISGWWACGYIQAAPDAHILMHDTWNRALVVADSTTTNGFMYLTASGPIGSYGRYHDSSSPIARLYENLLRFICSSSAVNR